LVTFKSNDNALLRTLKLEQTDNYGKMQG